MTEFYTLGIAPVLAADTELDVETSALTLFHGDLHELTDTRLIDGRKRILLHNFQFLIWRQERTGVVAAHPERHLGKVIGPKAEELSGLGDFIRR